MKDQLLSVYSCTLSPFGAAFLEMVIVHAPMQVGELVLASPDLWWRFHCKLKGFPQQGVPAKVLKRFVRQKKALAQALDNHHPDAAIRVVDTVHTTEECERLRGQAFVFCAGFPELFKQEVLSAPRLGMVNFHPSYLPRCRGAHPLYWTIAKREAFGGLSSHFMTTDIDAGPILHRERINFNPELVTYEELFQLVKQCIPQAISTTLQQLSAGRTLPTTEITETPTYHRNDREADHGVNWSRDDFATISAKIRAGQAFVELGESARLRLEPPLSLHKSGVKFSENASATYLSFEGSDWSFRSIDGIAFRCDLLPQEFHLWERIVLRLLRSFPTRRKALMQHIGRRILKAYYLTQLKSI